MKRLFYFISFLFLVACSSDDNQIDDNEVCNNIPPSARPGVSQTGFRIESLDNNDFRGYIIRASIENSNQVEVTGSPCFVLIVNGTLTTYCTRNIASATSCLKIEPNGSCDLEFRMHIYEIDGKIDPSPKFLCFHYQR